MAKADRAQRTDEGTEKFKRKLTKAARKFREAEDQYAAVRAEGEQSIRQARLEAEQRLAETARQLERRAEKLARLEEKMLSLNGGRGSDGGASSPEAAAEVLERLESESANHRTERFRLPDQESIQGG